jgi:hypothetical protein
MPRNNPFTPAAPLDDAEHKVRTQRHHQCKLDGAAARDIENIASLCRTSKRNTAVNIPRPYNYGLSFDPNHCVRNPC